jgi:hypothetical protein
MNEENTNDYPVSDSLKERFEERDLKDRFYLEELWQSLNEEFGVPIVENGWKSTEFLRSFLSELIAKVPLTKEEREAYIKEQFDIDWFPTWETLVEAELVEEESSND